MRIIPVIDVMNGVVVRAVAGRRAGYRPVRSRLTDSTEPFAVARALLDATGAAELYVADLDGLTRGVPNPALLKLADRLNVEVWLDIGLKDESGWVPALGLRPIIASETWSSSPHRSPSVGFRPILSLDYFDGALRSHREWNPADFRTVIVLDTAAVGMGQGVPTLPICAELRKRHPHLEIVTGGGVRSAEDLKMLEAAGVDAVLVASALHDRTLKV